MDTCMIDQRKNEINDLKYEENVKIYDLEDTAMKITFLNEDVRKELKCDMDDWELYMNCKESEEFAKSLPVSDLPSIRNICYGSNIISAVSKKCRNDMHNLNVHSKIEIQVTDECWNEISPEDEQQKLDQAFLEKTRGNVFYQSEKFDEACSHYTKSIALTQNKDAYNNRAQAKIKMGLYLSAIQDLNIVLQTDSNNVKALYRRAKCLKEIRMYEEALRDAQALSKISPGNGSAKKLLNDITNDISKLTGKMYRIRENFGDKKTFHIETSQLSVYANCDNDYVLEVDKYGCSKTCVCGYCIAEDFSNRNKCAGLKIKEKSRWKLLTNELLKS